MANAIPLLEGTSTSGGTLVIPASYGQTLVKGIQRESAVMQLARVQRVNTTAAKFSAYAGRPTAAFVAEAAAKGVTGAEYTELTINVKKIASIVLYTEELLADAREDPTVLINQDVAKAFSYLVDAHALGWTAGSTLSTSFDAAIGSSTLKVEYDATKDIAISISAAMAAVEANGYEPNGVVFNPDVRQVFRDARSGFGQPLFQTGWNSDLDSPQLFGMNVSFSNNLPTTQGNAASARVVGIVGDFNQAIAAIRQDLGVDFSNQATVDVSGTLHHLWQQNKSAARWEMRMGFNVYDVNRAFCLIVNES